MTYKDTPFDRQHVKTMTAGELNMHILRIREKRMAAVRLFKEAQAAKAKAKEQKDIELFNKRLDQIDNILQRIDKAFGTLDKYLADVAVLRLSLGDNVSNLNKLSGDS